MNDTLGAAAETVTDTVSDTVSQTTSALEKAIGFSFGDLTLGKIITTAVIFLICLVVIKLLLKIMDRAAKKSKLEPSLVGFLRNILKAILLFLAVLIAAGSLGFDVTSLIALLSVAGLAVSLAIQGSLSNLAGGITILVTKPFKTGDFIEAGGISGTVKQVSMFYTQIATIDNKIVFAPNSELTAGKITNYTYCDTRRVDITVTASYGSPISDVLSALKEAANVPQALPDPAVFAAVNAYKDSAIEYVLRAWVKTDDYWDAYFAITENIKHRFDDAHVEMTYPHMNVHLDK
jgi:small conductance mechanosensitive channel